MPTTLFGRMFPPGRHEHAPSPGRGVLLVHRIGAVLAAAVLVTFATAGVAGGLEFFSTEGRPVLGLSSNGLLSAISIATAVVLVAAAIRGGRTASTVLIVVGALFLISAFVNLALIGTVANLLAFRLPNVFFSIGAGLVLLLVGAYGRLSGRPPADNPYRSGDADDAGAPPPQPTPTTAAEALADRDMAVAEEAVAQHTATPDQARRVRAIGDLRTHEDRRQAWMRFQH
ncbi:DUF4383 domain-containing protein [Actinomycetospora endophytica]|uniref:DUF4383 domain-containing protein n=1 Tax=Actinomycetospora endophytica TaxID=2291215 RepID=A0ABS8PHE4_9PSEU|nr:DUF4383 domain-containing protein [Actinomycetospora endophytica]MCD2196910.1 DUF4383 domain-containing protein [Actinomycetospora endophytica]